MNRLSQLSTIAAGFLPYIRKPIGVREASAQLRDRVEKREARFLEVAGALIYSNPRSPYRRLLEYAGCAPGDLQSSVRARGLETTLENLRDAGVYLTAEEFKSRAPVCRRGLTFETTAEDFDNPYLMGRSLEARTSGSTSRPARVLYDWRFFEEEAAHELLLHAIHGVFESPAAFWYPGFPSISGVHNLLIHLKFRKPPDAWYSQLAGSTGSRFVMMGLSAICRLYGIRAPLPRHTPLDQAERVAAWMSRHRPCSLKAFTSSAVRVIRAAKSLGLDLSGSVIFTGGEPLTPARRSYIESAGVRAFPRYVATETGLVAAACDSGDAGSMHLYTDRLAVILREATRNDAGRMLFTTLSPTTGKVLLNAELGDAGRIRTAPCSCLFGQAGLQTHLDGIHNEDKLTGQGMSVPASTMNTVVGKLVAEMGGSPDDYQFWESDSEGDAGIVIAVDPSVAELKETAFRDEVLRRLRAEGVAAEIAAEFWKQAESLRVIRAQPRATEGFKQFSFAPPQTEGSRKS